MNVRRTASPDAQDASPPCALERAGRIAVIRLDNSPVNAISQAVVAALDAAMRTIECDRTFDAVVLHAAGRMFSSGGDLAEFSLPEFSARRLNDVLARIEDLDRPVVAALHGAVLGGGLELAMACHYRVCAPGTTFGQPEVLLGFPPGSLGTQRLLRLVGVRRAIEMLVTGATIDARRAAEAGLVDRIDEREPREAGIAYAESLVANVTGPRRTRDLAVVEDGADANARAAAMRDAEARAAQNPAPRAILQCVEAGIADFDDGAAIEAASFQHCRHSPPSRALQHLFFAERDAGKLPADAARASVRPIQSIGVVGAGTMGSGIAMAFANAHLPVVLVDVAQPALERGLRTIRERYEASAAKGKLDATQVDRRVKLISGALTHDALSQCDLLIEAVYEDFALKRGVCAQLSEHCKPGAIIATNTSTLDVDALAQASGRPADFVGLHFFSPAHVMRLLEVVRGRATAPDVLATVMSIAKRIGKTPVVSGVCYGFIGNRMSEVNMREAEFMLMEGATPAQIDAVAEGPEWGMAMGPCRMLDMAGIDVGAHTVIEWRKSGGAPADPRYRAVCRALFEAGRNGQKSGRGYYRYDGRRASDDPDTERLCSRLAAAHGITRRAEIPAQQIFERLLFPMINEAAKILDEGIAVRPGDIDVVWTFGFGFPRHRGGPVYMADEIGVAHIVQRLRHYGRVLGDAHGYWEVAPLLDTVARQRGRLSAWRAPGQSDRAPSPPASARIA
ncbi:MAG TPA: 3-hydroxyacyl-CoA dehydrogenase NAD-binding domain-containing protein [Casimicrobiaceae bacterium]|nr:3-hydroxyacyl-CoA dehydrogenase NAD-binding domain-containing protein [Casimicrobiaceae bacterium]